MHELGIAKEFWSVISRRAADSGITKISKITIVLGEASGIEEEFLRHSLSDHILPGTIASEAELVLIKRPLLARCLGCSSEISKDTLKGLSCPRCGSSDIEIASGRETYVENIEGT